MSLRQLLRLEQNVLSESIHVNKATEEELASSSKMACAKTKVVPKVPKTKAPRNASSGSTTAPPSVMPKGKDGKGKKSNQERPKSSSETPSSETPSEQTLPNREQPPKRLKSASVAPAEPAQQDALAKESDGGCGLAMG